MSAVKFFQNHAGNQKTGNDEKYINPYESPCNSGQLEVERDDHQYENAAQPLYIAAVAER